MFTFAKKSKVHFCMISTFEEKWLKGPKVTPETQRVIFSRAEAAYPPRNDGQDQRARRLRARLRFRRRRLRPWYPRPPTPIRRQALRCGHAAAKDPGPHVLWKVLVCMPSRAENTATGAASVGQKAVQSCEGLPGRGLPCGRAGRRSTRVELTGLFLSRPPARPRSPVMPHRRGESPAVLPF